MPSTREIREQVEHETERRSRLAVPAFAGGVLYLLSAIIIASTLNGAPTVGVFQGLKPAIEGVANPAVSPRTVEVKFISHHAFPLVAGSVLAAIAVAALTLILLLLLEAVRFRRPGTWPPTRSFVLYGGIAVAVISIAHQVVSALETHKFATGHDFTAHAVDQALTKATPNLIVAYLSLLAGLALAVGMISVMINALRTGLVVRWIGVLGMFTALLIVLPIGGAELQVVPALWMVMMGLLFVGRWPNGEPAAWAAGEARPWPSAAQRRADAAPRAGGNGRPATAPAAGDVAPAPPVRSSSRKRRRKRGARG
jgi:hypothetical protein